MRRVKVLSGVAVMVLVAAGCVGGTDSATDVKAHSAKLWAHGRTDNGPAYWWWEYGTTRKAVEQGLGTKTARSGPASSATDVRVSKTVTGLDRVQSYYFRACAQDQAAGGQPTCGAVLTFSTAPGDSTVQEASGDVAFHGASDVRHDIRLAAPSLEEVRITEYEDASTTPPTGSSIAALDTSCFTSRSDYLRSYDDVATCAPGATDPSSEIIVGNYADAIDAYGVPGYVAAFLGGGDDSYTGGNGIDNVSGEAGNDILYGYEEDDTLRGGPGNDTIDGGLDHDDVYGDDGNDSLYGGDGDDTIYGGRGTNGYNCGPGNDVIHVNTYDEWGSRSTGCESYVIDQPA
jgi:Ca2+-binding RTX toxin-like protein